MCLAKCSLLVKLRVQGGKSVQKNLWPFFFFVGLPVSASTLSSSEPPSPSSDSSMSISCEPVERWEFSLLGRLGRDWSVDCDDEVNEERKGEVGSGL